MSWNWTKRITKNKAFEIELYKSQYWFSNEIKIRIGGDSFIFIFDLLGLFRVYFSINGKCDHAGIFLIIRFFRYNINLNIHDNRHWDYENNCWENNI